MNFEETLYHMKHRVWRLREPRFLLCVVLAQNLLAVDVGAIRIEEAQRAFQERHKMVLGKSVSWPPNAVSQPAPEFPPDGFYEADLSNAVDAAYLVADLATKFDDSRLLWNFTSALGGDLEGADGYYDKTAPLLGDRLIMPRPADVTPDNYPVQFSRLTRGLCEARYVVVTAEQVGSTGAGTPVEKRSGRSVDEDGCSIFQSSNWPDFGVPIDVQDSGSFTLEFQQRLAPGHYHVYVNDCYYAPAAFSTGHWTVGGVTADQISDPEEWIYSYYYGPEIGWSNVIWRTHSPCEVPNEISPGTELTEFFVNDKTIQIPWELEVTECTNASYYSYFLQLEGTQTFTCEEHWQRVEDSWEANAWEDDPCGGIGVSVISDYGHELTSWRGRLYANLTNFNGTARCYLSLSGGDFEIEIAGSAIQPGPVKRADAPVATDLTWHFFESVPTGAEWTSDVLGDTKPTVENCTEQWSWFIVHQVVIVTPDFRYNIKDCELCDACGDGCTPGSASTSLTAEGALSVNVDLGRDSFGESAGELCLYASRPIPDLTDPLALAYHTSMPSDVRRGTNNVLRQVRNSQVLVDIVAGTNRDYEIRFYPAANAGTTNDCGFYLPAGDPYQTIIVGNPDSSGATFSQLRVTESGDGVDRVSEFAWSDEMQQWTLITGNGLRRESHTTERTPFGDRREIYTVADGAGQPVRYKERRTVRMFDWGEEVVEKVVDPDAAALTTTWSYYDDSRADGDNYSHLKEMVEPSGYWERYQYDSLGRVIELVSQYLDADTDAPDDQCRVTTTVYGTNGPAVTVIETLQGSEVSRRYTVYRPGERREIRAVTPGANWDDPANLVTITRTYLGGAFEGKVQSVTRPDGTMSIYQYAIASSDTGSNLITTVSVGEPAPGDTAVINGSKTVTLENEAGTTIREERRDIADGNDTLLTWNQAVVVDDFGRATRIDYSDGTSAATVYGCCGILSTSDREGIATAYAYDALKRTVATTQAGITTSNSFDAAGRVTGTVRIGIDGSAVGLDAMTYDVAGHLTASTDGLTNTTRYGEQIDDDGYTVRTTTYPDKTTRVEKYYPDGRIRSLIGSAVRGVGFEYGVDENDGVHCAYTKEIKLDADGNNSSEWSKTYTDMLGRVYLTVFADDAYGQLFFNEKAQLWKQRDPDGVVRLFVYNRRGELETIAIDMDRDDVIDYDGTDRISRAQSSVLTAHGTTVRRTTVSVWTTDDRDEAITTAVSDISVDGLTSWTMAFGLTNSVATAYDRPNARRTDTETASDGTRHISVYEDGRLQSSVTVNPELGTMNSQSYQYDAHGRLSRWIDARTGATGYTYNDADQLLSMFTDDQTITRQYDPRGRQTQVVLPDKGTVTAEYFDTGELKRIYGARTYPVQYTYDYAGRMKTMTTWKNFAGDSGTATTTWNYDPRRGFLTGKVYDDCRRVTYCNSAAGRLLSRMWARDLTTRYGYDAAGELTSVSYDDGVTPSAAWIYDRRGRRTSVTCGTDTCVYAYNDAGQLLAESFPGSGIVVSNTYDSLLRRSLSILDSKLGTSNPVTYAYDAASRLRAVNAGVYSATYSYLANCSLIGSIVLSVDGITKMIATKSYDKLNRLERVDNVSPTLATNLSYAYQYNSASLRTRVNLADGGYWLYQYDSLGQVASGKKHWPDGTEVAGQQFGYEFDDIGNRKLATVNGRESTYTANGLNQYTQRGVPGAVDILGTAASNATVTVNNQTTTRNGEYFYRGLSVSNTASAAYTNIWVVGVRRNVGTNQQDVVATTTGSEYLPKTPEEFSYDADGNLTSDGRWIYTWDGENRLIAVESLTNAPSASKQKLEFAYDWQGRRIQKKVYAWESDCWSLIADLRFVYDGWNLVAELDGLSNPSGPMIKRSYTWGLDVSGTEQGAGGVGGLLSVTDHEPPVTTHFVSYDGNGDVVALLDPRSATLSAQYEYGPFGETIRATGPAVSLNPCRFSTKYTDSETGLLYYGRRYHSASTGRWISRDPIGERGGANLYTFVVNCPEKWTDPVGLLLAAVDGSGSRSWLTRDIDTRRWNSHVRNFFTDYVAPGPKRYWQGPDRETTGFDSLSIHKEVVKWICSILAEQPNEPINLVGHSRGGYIVMQVALQLGEKGCPCDKDQKDSTQKTNIRPPIRVNFLGLYDPVDMVLGYGKGESVPSNVDHAANAMGDPRVHSRPYFNTVDQGAEDTSVTDYSERLFDATHGGMGGDPWRGDHPRGMTEERDRAGSVAADAWIRQHARAAGISLAN